MSCVLCESYTVQNEPGLCLAYCVSRILFRMSLAMEVRCATYSVSLPRSNDKDSFHKYSE